MHCEDDRHDDISEDTSLPYLEARDRDMYCQYSRRMVSCSSDRAVHSWKTDNLKCAGWRPHNKNLKKIWKKRRLYLPHHITQNKNSGGILCSVPRKKSSFHCLYDCFWVKSFKNGGLQHCKLWIFILPLSSHAHACVHLSSTFTPTCTITPPLLSSHTCPSPPPPLTYPHNTHTHTHR